MIENTTTFRSIFSYEKNDQNPKLWVRYSPTTHKSIVSTTCIFSKLAGKLKLSSQKIIENQFFISENNLLYYKETKNHHKIKGVLDLNFSRVQYIKLEKKENNSYSYKLKFIKYLKFSDLFIKSEQDFDKWTNFLKKRTTQSKFYQKYLPIKQIGEGGFATVF